MNEEKAESLKKTITRKKIETEIKYLPKNKSPGQNEFVVSFIKHSEICYH